MTTPLLLALMSLTATGMEGGAAFGANAPADAPVKVWLSARDDLRQGDAVRVYARSQVDGYLVVFHAEPDGRVRVLFPLDPYNDYYVRGGKEYEVLGRGDREAITVYTASGFGTVYAAFSRDPFRFDEFVRGDHWDYQLESVWRVGDDAEADLTDLAQRMAVSRFDYDIVRYDVGRPVAYDGGYGWYGGGYAGGGYYGSPGLHVSFGLRYGHGYYRFHRSRYHYYPGLFCGNPFYCGVHYYDPFFYDPFYYDPFYYGAFFYYPYSFYSPYAFYPYRTRVFVYGRPVSFPVQKYAFKPFGTTRVASVDYRQRTPSVNPGGRRGTEVGASFGTRDRGASLLSPSSGDRRAPAARRPDDGSGRRATPAASQPAARDVPRTNGGRELRPGNDRTPKDRVAPPSDRTPTRRAAPSSDRSQTRQAGPDRNRGSNSTIRVVRPGRGSSDGSVQRPAPGNGTRSAPPARSGTRATGRPIQSQRPVRVISPQVPYIVQPPDQPLVVARPDQSGGGVRVHRPDRGPAAETPLRSWGRVVSPRSPTAPAPSARQAPGGGRAPSAGRAAPSGRSSAGSWRPTSGSRGQASVGRGTTTTIRRAPSSGRRASPVRGVSRSRSGGR